jgi:hypothetical protein
MGFFESWGSNFRMGEKRIFRKMSNKTSKFWPNFAQESLQTRLLLKEERKSRTLDWNAVPGRDSEDLKSPFCYGLLISLC